MSNEETFDEEVSSGKEDVNTIDNSNGFVTTNIIPMQRLRNNEAALFVGGLSFSATEEDLRAAFSSVGSIVSVRIVQDRDTGKPRGFAFVNFETPECVDMAIRQCQGMELCGRNVRLDRSAAGIVGGKYNGGMMIPMYSSNRIIPVNNGSVTPSLVGNNGCSQPAVVPIRLTSAGPVATTSSSHSNTAANGGYNMNNGYYMHAMGNPMAAAASPEYYMYHPATHPSMMAAATAAASASVNPYNGGPYYHNQMYPSQPSNGYMYPMDGSVGPQAPPPPTGGAYMQPPHYLPMQFNMFNYQGGLPHGVHVATPPSPDPSMFLSTALPAESVGSSMTVISGGERSVTGQQHAQVGNNTYQ